MISNKLKVFERNRYFYGKLLTAEDFITEQIYFNDKRRLLNNMLFGSGVVTGMSVVKADDQSIAVDSGFALDSSGREIIISEPKVIKVNELNGYSSFIRSHTDYTTAYLCIEYDEKQSQPIHSIAKTVLDDENEGPEYNRITEGYSLYITDEEPEKFMCESENLALKRKILISDGINVSIICPSIVREGEEFILETQVNKVNTEKNITIDFDLRLELFTAENSNNSTGKNIVHISYDQCDSSDSETIVIRTKLKAMGSSGRKGIIRADNIHAAFGKRKSAAYPIQIEVDIAENRADSIIKMLRKQQTDNNEKLYIAKLELFVSPQYYILESVEDLPFCQAVPTAVDMRSFQIRSEFICPPSENKTVSHMIPPANQPVVNTGTAYVLIPEKARKGNIYYSNNIPHGLGTGVVFINAGYVDDKKIIFEESSLLNNNFSYSIIVDEDSGTFSVAVRINSDIKKTNLKFCWIASRFPDMGNSERKIEINPSVRYAGRYETVHFDVSHPDGKVWKNGELEWSVHPDNGGQITSSGIFTAFDIPGFYEIRVKSIAEPDLNATAFLVVQ